MRAKNNIDIVAMLAFVLTCSACGNKERANEFGIVEDQIITSDTVIVPVKVEVEKSVEMPVSPASSSTSTTHVGESPKYNNMRGFDPASEDDMDDNGMSRYMENYDDEGWD
jgi:hypothetical protein